MRTVLWTLNLKVVKGKGFHKLIFRRVSRHLNLSPEFLQLQQIPSIVFARYVIKHLRNSTCFTSTLSLRSAHIRGLFAGTCFGVQSPSTLRILHRNSSRRHHILGPCDISHKLSWFDFQDKSQGPTVPYIGQFSSVYTQRDKSLRLVFKLQVCA